MTNHSGPGGGQEESVSYGRRTVYRVRDLSDVSFRTGLRVVKPDQVLRHPHAGVEFLTGRRFVLLDRDGTLIRERHYLTDPDEVELITGASEALKRMRALGLGIIVVTNQSAMGRGMLDGVRLEQIHDRLRALLAAQGVALDAIYVCPHTPDDRCECRKPRPGLVERARRELELDPRRSFVVGDQASDIALGAGVGATTLLVCTGYGAETALARRVLPDHTVRDVAAAAEMIECLLAAEVTGGRDVIRG